MKEAASTLTGVWLAEEDDQGEEDAGDGERRAPRIVPAALLEQYAQADGAALVDVWVVYRRRELDLGRVKRVLVAGVGKKEEWYLARHSVRDKLGKGNQPGLGQMDLRACGRCDMVLEWQVLRGAGGRLCSGRLLA